MSEETGTLTAERPRRRIAKTRYEQRCAPGGGSSTMSLVKIVRSRLRRSVALMAVTGGLAWTHHYLVASYDFTRTVTVEGEVAQFLFRKPHSFLRLETRKEQGGPQMWLAEWGDGSQLSRAGVFADTLRPGDRVVVAGNPARDATEHKLRVVTIRRLSDGWNWTAATD